MFENKHTCMPFVELNIFSNTKVNAIYDFMTQHICLNATLHMSKRWITNIVYA